MAKKRNKRMVSYYAWYRKVRTPKFKPVAVMKGTRLETSDALFIRTCQTVKPSSLEYPVLLEDNKLRFNVYDVNTNKMIAKVDRALNIYSLDNIYVGTLYNQFKALITIIILLLVVAAVTVTGLLTLNKSGYFTHAQDVIISEKNGGIVTDKWNILVDPYGRKLIAPGRATSYYFTLTSENYTDTTVNLYFDEINEAAIPMEYRLYHDGKFLVGSQTEWVSVEELMASEINIAAYESESFRLDWHWRDNDEFDTALGVEGKDTYTILVTVESFFK